jgi:hypothetical protein
MICYLSLTFASLLLFILQSAFLFHSPSSAISIYKGDKIQVNNASYNREVRGEVFDERIWLLKTQLEQANR